MKLRKGSREPREPRVEEHIVVPTGDALRVLELFEKEQRLTRAKISTAIIPEIPLGTLDDALSTLIKGD